MKLFEPIVVDLYNPYPLKKVNMQQNNIGRGVLVTLTAGSMVVNPKGEDVKLWANRPDEKVSYLSCEIQTDGTIKAPFSSQMLAKTGKVVVMLELIRGEDYITTPIFYVNNNVNIADHAAVESTDEFTALQNAISDMNLLMENHSLTEADVQDIYAELYP